MGTLQQDVPLPGSFESRSQPYYGSPNTRQQLLLNHVFVVLFMCFAGCVKGTAGTTTCTMCGVGEWAPGGTESCTACPAGSTTAGNFSYSLDQCSGKGHRVHSVSVGSCQRWWIDPQHQFVPDQSSMCSVCLRLAFGTLPLCTDQCQNRSCGTVAGAHARQQDAAATFPTKTTLVTVIWLLTRNTALLSAPRVCCCSVHSWP